MRDQPNSLSDNPLKKIKNELVNSNRTVMTSLNLIFHFRLSGASVKVEGLKAKIS